MSLGLFDFLNPVSDEVQTETQQVGVDTAVTNALGEFNEEDLNQAIDDIVREAKENPCPESNNENSTSSHVGGPTLGGTVPLPSNITEELQQSAEDNVLSETEAQSDNSPSAPASTDENEDADGTTEGLDDEEILQQTMSTQQFPGIGYANTASSDPDDPTGRDSHVYSLENNVGHFSNLSTEHGGPMSVSDAIMDFSYNDAKNDGEVNYMMGLVPNLTSAMSSLTTMSLDYTSGADSNNGYSSLTTTTDTQTLDNLLGGEIGVAVQFDGSENLATAAIHSLAELIGPGVDSDTAVTLGLTLDYQPGVELHGTELQPEDTMFGIIGGWSF